MPGLAILTLSDLPSGASEGEKGGESEPTLEHGDPSGSVAAGAAAAVLGIGPGIGFGILSSADVEDAALLGADAFAAVSIAAADSSLLETVADAATSDVAGDFVGESGTDSTEESALFGDAVRTISRNAAFADDCAAAAAKKAVGAICTSFAGEEDLVSFMCGSQNEASMSSKVDACAAGSVRMQSRS